MALVCLLLPYQNGISFSVISAKVIYLTVAFLPPPSHHRNDISISVISAKVIYLIRATPLSRLNRIFTSYIREGNRTYLGFRLLPHQNDVPGGVVDGYVRDVDALADQLVQFLDARRAQEQDGVRLLEK